LGLRDLVLGLRELVGLLGRTSGGKSDRFDAFVLCELAQTDSHRFRVLVPDGDQTEALRALTRAREDLVGTRVALANQLRAELKRFWPEPTRVLAFAMTGSSYSIVDQPRGGYRAA
jgi:transposase